VVEPIAEAVSTPSRSPRQYMPPFTCAHKRHSGSRPEPSLLGQRRELDNPVKRADASRRGSLDLRQYWNEVELIDGLGLLPD
jgi:hypothetical protein